MKIPKYIDKALKKRTKYAEQLNVQVDLIDEWLEKHGWLNSAEIQDAVLTGCLIYTESGVAEKVIREFIEKQ